MGLASFLSSLFAGGRVRVNADALLSAEDVEQSQRSWWLLNRRVEMICRGSPPALSSWKPRSTAPRRFTAACQFLVFRDVEPEAIQRELGRGWPGRLSPPCPLQRRPDAAILARCRTAGPRRIRRRPARDRADPVGWPLAAVRGRCPRRRGRRCGAIVADACLLGMYVDRIIARQ